MAINLRARLESLAKGIAPATDGDTLDIAFVQQHAEAFNAWHAFAKSAGQGEPVPAPPELLAPLP